MLVFSETLMRFRDRFFQELITIARHEMGLDMGRTRIYFDDYTYPIHFVIFEHPHYLGLYEPDFYRISLNKQLILSATDETICNILRHELAHMMVHLEGGQGSAHGKEFHEICRRYGWGPEVSNATYQLEEENKIIHKTHILEKIKKLMALADSDNTHEAHLATLKANQLLLKHQLEFYESSSDEEFFVKQILFFKRSNGKIRAIAKILQSFFVAPIINHGRSGMWLEVTGSRTHVEVADYVAKYLDHHLEYLWKQIKKNHTFNKGSRSKNSFMEGVAKGYDQKMKMSLDELTTTDQTALIKIDQDLDRKLELAYGKLSRKSRRGFIDKLGQSLGIQQGHELSIRPGLQEKEKKTYLLT